ncbi:MAG: N-acetyltransferase [Planctomycetes bacterium]|nr:N-acetyltransferase [Planctomycetota bacterium]
MAKLEIKPVQSRREEQQFLDLPWKLYEGNPNWIPPLRANQRELVGFKPHPFYNDAEGQAFLAVRDGEVQGRVLALVNHAHNRRHKEERGFFGFFECVDDQEVADALFGAVRNWLAERHIHKLRGPANPSLNYECGLLIEGFDSPPTFMMTYNPPYYPRLIESAGFTKVQDLYAYEAHKDMLATVDPKLAFIIGEATRRFDVKLRSLDTSRFLDEVKLFLDIYNKSLVGTWGFVPLSEAEVQHLAGSLKRLIVPELTVVAEVEGRPVGAMFALLDYNPRIKKINGRLFPFGFIRLLWNRKKIPRARLLSANVLPEFQRWGLGLVLGAHMVPQGLEWGMSEAEMSWVLESNHLSRKSIERGGGRRTKTYRIYDSDAE